MNLQCQLKNSERETHSFKLKDQHNILLAFYGDDFTGSTDALEFISRAGAEAVLFTEPPDSEQLNRFPDLQAYGIAGATRAMAPDQMEEDLLPAFKKMKASGAAFIHYKVCSTFDSSPTTGSIGKAIDCGSTVFGNALIPILGGTPSLGRYCLFAHLFARMGTVNNGPVYRIDRHPSMSKHPVTPAAESDLRLHIGGQTKKNIGSIDINQMQQSVQEWTSHLEKDTRVVILDALDSTHLQHTGEWLQELKSDQPVFCVGGSAVEDALGTYWNKSGILQPVISWSDPEPAENLLVIAGSCSPVTAKQMAVAAANGFSLFEIDPANPHEGKSRLITDLVQALQQNEKVILHSGKKLDNTIAAATLGSALGTIAKEVICLTKVHRLIVAGGDTSSYAARALEIEAVKMVGTWSAGAPLCRAYSSNKSIDGLQVNFKGGQVGNENYFLEAVRGKST
ncbi:MAG: four-carbon acid sugar kinase family protein [Chitinophagaceae bacterium]|nr:four-carbon acid sugar kinase family protein [Chitinophagaceae bacterium]